MSIDLASVQLYGSVHAHSMPSQLFLFIQSRAASVLVLHNACLSEITRYVHCGGFNCCFRVRLRNIESVYGKRPSLWHSYTYERKYIPIQVW